jgi:hypothetical protein
LKLTLQLFIELVEQLGVGKFLTSQCRQDCFLQRFIVLLADVLATFAQWMFGEYLFFAHYFSLAAE